jgi:hypothetical protein
MDGVAQRAQEFYSDATPGGGQLYAEGVLEGIRPDLNGLQEVCLRRKRRGVSCSASGFTDIPEVAVIAGEELDEVPLIGEDALDAIQLGGVGNYAEGDGGVDGAILSGPTGVVDVGDIEGGEDTCWFGGRRGRGCRGRGRFYPCLPGSRPDAGWGRRGFWGLRHRGVGWGCRGGSGPACFRRVRWRHTGCRHRRYSGVKLRAVYWSWRGRQ